MADEKQNITLRILGRAYAMTIDSRKEEVMRTAEQEVNKIAGVFERERFVGHQAQDFLALTALQLAIDNITMSRSLSVGDDDVKALNALNDRVGAYLNRLDTDGL